MKVYLVLEVHFSFYNVLKAFAKKPKADEFAKKMKNKLPNRSKAVYDSYGLIDGIEYKVIDLKLEE